MTSAQGLLEQAKAIAALDRADMSGNLQSFLATFDAKVDQDDSRGAAVWARTVVKIAAREGISTSKPTTVPDLKVEIARRNEGRDDADQIKPASNKKADLEQALADDDAASAG